MLSWMQKFVKILLKFDKILTKICQNSAKSSRLPVSKKTFLGVVAVHLNLLALRQVFRVLACRMEASFARSSSSWATTPSLFPRLVLGWIDADFRVQIRVLQHFSKSTRKSSSRKQMCKILTNCLRFLQKIENV